MYVCMYVYIVKHSNIEMKNLAFFYFIFLFFFLFWFLLFLYSPTHDLSSTYKYKPEGCLVYVCVGVCVFVWVFMNVGFLNKWWRIFIFKNSDTFCGNIRSNNNNMLIYLYNIHTQDTPDTPKYSHILQTYYIVCTYVNIWS